MDNIKQIQRRLVKRLCKPWYLIGQVLTYCIGIGLAHYIGIPLDWGNILMGLILVWCLFVMQSLLSAWYEHPTSLTSTIHSEDPRYKELNSVNRQTLLICALSIMTVGAAISVVLMLKHVFTLQTIIILGLAFLLCYLSAVPPIQLAKRGYLEIVEAILIANITPAVGYLMNAADLSPLLATLTLPLTLLYLALSIVQGLETYAFDRTHAVQSIVTRLEWKNAMNGHNILLLMAFLFVGVFSITGQPWSLSWPMFLPIFPAIFQIAQIMMILRGSPPRWKLLKSNAVGTFAIMAYLIVLSLWGG